MEAHVGTRRRRIWIAIAIAFLLIAGASVFAWRKFGDETKRRDDLWRVVHDVCSSDQRVLQHPTPCIEVDRAKGFALVPGGLYSDELLVVPTRRIAGIEDPTLLDPATPNYWAFAWDERHHLSREGHAVPDSWIGLAVNSTLSRTQDQLHIHLDCVSPQVRRALEAQSLISRHWHKFDPLPGHHYEVKLIDAATLRTTSPFRIVAGAVGHDPSVMARQTLVLIGAPDGADASQFYLLRQSFRPEAGQNGHGEELLDHDCTGLKAPGPSPT